MSCGRVHDNSVMEEFDSVKRENRLNRVENRNREIEESKKFDIETLLGKVFTCSDTLARC